MADAIKAILSDKALLFMNVTPGEQTKKWALMNKGIESAEISFNPTEQERHFIADKNSTKLTTGLSKSLDQTQYAYKNDETFEFIDELIFNEAIGDDAVTQVLQVFVYKTADMETVTAVPSKMQDVNISIASRTLTGGDQMQIGYNVNFSGDPTFGTSTITDGVPVFTEAAE